MFKCQEEELLFLRFIVLIERIYSHFFLLLNIVISLVEL